MPPANLFSGKRRRRATERRPCLATQVGLGSKRAESNNDASRNEVSWLTARRALRSDCASVVVVQETTNLIYLKYWRAARSKQTETHQVSRKPRHNDTHTTHSTTSSNAKLGIETLSRKRKPDIRDANADNAGQAFPGLPNHLVVVHILRSAYFDDPADLARLPAVSQEMRDTVAGTGFQFEELAEKHTVQFGCLSAVKRLQRRGLLSRQEHLCTAAARSGQLEELKVLRENNTPWDRGTCRAAARDGHLDVLQWIYANGCPWDYKTCAHAAKGGHLEALQWLHANGCPWNEDTCAGAAKYGQLEVLQWARANGCPWNDDVLRNATFVGHTDVVLALIKAGMDVNKARNDGETPLFIAAQNGHEAIVRVLIESGAGINKAMVDGETPLYSAAEKGHVAIVRVLIEAGADVNKGKVIGAMPLHVAAQNGHKMVVRVLIEAGADINIATDDGATPLSISMTPVVNVAQGGHAAIVQILKDGGAV
ncbi:ankyrin repeat domain-containing protein [bacterium]|nr:ankyrin repeat domain-containing protein [bacterium]